MDFTYNQTAKRFTVRCADDTEVDAVFDLLTEYRRANTSVYFIIFPDGKTFSECFDTIESAEESVINTPNEYRPQGTYTIYQTTLADFLNDVCVNCNEVRQLSFTTE